MLKKSRGRYTDQQIERVGIMSGAFGKEVRGTIEDIMGLPRHGTRRKTPTEYRTDVHKFSTLTKNARLFDYVAKRGDPNFPNYTHQVRITNPLNLAKQIQKLSKSMDFYRERSLLSCKHQ